MSTSDRLQSSLNLHQAGQIAAAERIYRELLAESEAQASVWHLLGVACLQLGRATEAVPALERAVQLDPTQSEYFSHLGAAYGALQQHDPAISSLRRAVQLAPQSASAHYNLGTALRNADQLTDAVTSFRHAVAADPNSAEAHYNLANTLRELVRPEEAEASYRAAIQARPGYIKAMLNLGNLLAGLKRYDESLALLRQAVALDPRHARSHLNLGTVLRDSRQFEAALDALRQAVALDPNMAEAHNNLGTVLQALGDESAAAECYETALHLNPELSDAHFSYATYLLRQGELARGFAEYEWRWRCKSYTNRKFEQPRWDGSPLAGRTILLHAEQGLGDTLNFLRYAADAKQTGGMVIVECQKALHKLCAGVPGVDRFIAPGDPLPRHDVQCPLLSLPAVLGLSMDELARGAYLSADPARIEKWRERLADVFGRRVGVCWQGNREHLFDSQRSFPLEQLAGVAAVPGLRLISLQHGFGTEQIPSASFEVQTLGEELDRDGAFLDTAAVMKNLDLVITADSAIAHVAAALGVPTWIALSANGDWRWFTDRDDSPWYPSVRLFRQRRLNDWEDVFERMAQSLADKSQPEA